MEDWELTPVSYLFHQRDPAKEVPLSKFFNVLADTFVLILPCATQDVLGQTLHWSIVAAPSGESFKCQLN